MNFFLVICLLPLVAESAHWSYEPKSPDGPANWYQNYPKCAGHAQSPINIKLDEVTPACFDINFYYKTCKRRCEYEVKNNGHSLQVNIPEKAALSITLYGGKRPAKYILDQFHFHWGKKNHVGSEHIAGRSFPAELHLVHHKASYGSFEEAMKHSDGLAVVGLLIKVGRPNRGLNPLFNRLRVINTVKNAASGRTAKVRCFDIRKIDRRGFQNRQFFHYHGSLTTPPCNEVVIWSVMTTAVTMSQRQLRLLRSLRDSHGRQIGDNYRPAQPINDRKIYVNDLRC